MTLNIIDGPALGPSDDVAHSPEDTEDGCVPWCHFYVYPCPRWCSGEHTNGATDRGNPESHYHHKAPWCPDWCAGHLGDNAEPRRRGGRRGSPHLTMLELRHDAIGEIWEALGTASATTRRDCVLYAWTIEQVREVRPDIADALDATAEGDAPFGGMPDVCISRLHFSVPTETHTADWCAAHRAGFDEGVKLALRDYRTTTWWYQVGWALRFFRQPDHPEADLVHPVARLAAVVLRRRFAVGDTAPCCRFERLTAVAPWLPGCHVWCGDCGTLYRRRSLARKNTR